tara:strand:+ start:3208 stop:3822 length:615 start_codon:yes stop_codon:yes gene_type:complete
MSIRKKEGEQEIIWSRILAVLVVILIIGFVGYWGYFLVFDNNEEYTLEEWNEIVSTKSDIITEDQLDFTLTNEEKESCLSQLSENCPFNANCKLLYSTSCIVYLRKDISLCEILEDSSFIQACEIWLSSDPDECEKLTLPDQKAWCFATSTNEVKYCSQLSDESAKYLCLAQLTKEISYCNKIPIESSAESCFNVLSSERGEDS